MFSMPKYVIEDQFTAHILKPTCITEGQVLGIFLYQFIFIFVSQWLFIRRFISLFIQCFHLRLWATGPQALGPGAHMQLISLQLTRANGPC